MTLLRSTSLRIVASVVLAAAWAASYLDLNPASVFHGPAAWDLIGRFFRAALSPAWTAQGGTGIGLLPKAIDGIRATVLFASAGMSIALVIGAGLGFLASSSWWEQDPIGRGRSSRSLRRVVPPFVTACARGFIAVMRSVHELLWAMLFLSAMGLSNMSAVLAIAVPYGGTLAKVFAELIDEAPRDAGYALRSAGATPLQVFLVGFLPRAMPDLGAYALYRFECALRSSAVLGFFGFPTLGYYIGASFENLYYGEVWTYLYALFGLIVVVELWSGRLRRREPVA